jgi:hypothetical protein
LVTRLDAFAVSVEQAFAHAHGEYVLLLGDHESVVVRASYFDPFRARMVPWFECGTSPQFSQHESGEECVCTPKKQGV